MPEQSLVLRAVINQQHRVQAIADDLRAMRERVASIGSADLSASDLFSLSATIFEFKPDLILELGRGWGTSTALFRITGTPTVSVCRSTNWQDQTLPALKRGKRFDWNRGIDLHVGEIQGRDYAPLLAGRERVLVFWDAHGYDVADAVLGRILPMLAEGGRTVLVACHDMRDSRYCIGDDAYAGKSLWRNQEEPDSEFVRLGNVHSSFEQLVSIVDFTSRNAIPFVSPSHELATHPETRRLWPDRWWPMVLWHYFELPLDRELTFPRPRA